MPDSPAAPPSQLLGGRYRLQRTIARGGMATVWHGHDEVLGRDVAVKLLHPHLADDPAFLDRFRREARAAAALNHPNVVAVYDWGEDAVGAYLIMELVDGPSLRDVLRLRGRLTPGEVLSILAPVADALSAAHEAELVHRDIKPENVLLAPSGSVKVTDFGLARAVASSTHTFGTDVIVGSPHYLAPEAVRGVVQGPRADIYAMGVVLFECLTGRPPYEGDTAMATALAHAANTVPDPSSVVPGLPHALDLVVRRATAPEPEDRFADAHTFAATLADAVPGGPVPIDLRDGAHHTVVLPVDATDTIVRARQAAAAPPRGGTTPGGPTSPERPRRRGRRRLLGALTVLLVLAGAGVAAWAFLLAPMTVIPSIVGLSEQEAAAQLERAGFDAVVADQGEHSLTVPAGAVVSHDPEGSARKGATVTIVLSDGPRQLTLPDLTGELRDDAESALRELGVEPVVTEVYSETVEQGRVVALVPASGAVVAEASQVEIQVSLGREPITVPDTVTKDADAAVEQLETLGFDAVIIDEVHSEDVPEGHVVEQNPPAGETRFRGDQIQLTVSKGPKLFPMPDVVGRSEGEATEILRNVGLVVEVERVSAFLRPSGQVARTDPERDTPVRRGQTVTLFVWD